MAETPSVVHDTEWPFLNRGRKGKTKTRLAFLGLFLKEHSPLGNRNFSY